MAVTIKTDRIDFRINEADKQKLEKAAQIKHLSLASYIASTILKQADIDIQENELLLLNEKDSKLILDLLNETVEPNERLIKLLKQ